MSNKKLAAAIYEALQESPSLTNIQITFEGSQNDDEDTTYILSSENGTHVVLKKIGHNTFTTATEEQ